MATAGGAFGGGRSAPPKPPEKGVFPLDHFGECKDVADSYKACVKAHQDSSHCRDIAVAYLQCRMDRDLMARQDLRELGLAPDTKADPAPTAPQH